MVVTGLGRQGAQGRIRGWKNARQSRLRWNGCVQRRNLPDAGDRQRPRLGRQTSLLSLTIARLTARHRFWTASRLIVGLWQSQPWAISALNRGLAVAVGKVLIWGGGMLKHQLRILEPRRMSRRSLEGCASSSVLRS
jgi:hypothetical protein